MILKMRFYNNSIIIRRFLGVLFILLSLSFSSCKETDPEQEREQKLDDARSELLKKMSEIQDDLKTLKQDSATLETDSLLHLMIEKIKNDSLQETH